jgi:hypothetical protein
MCAKKIEAQGEPRKRLHNKGKRKTVSRDPQESDSLFDDSQPESVAELEEVGIGPQDLLPEAR